MNHIDILIPCAPDRYFPQLVMDHILIQDIPIRLFFSNAKGDGAASARNYVKDMWQNSPDQSEYVLMADNDIIFPQGSFHALINFLNNNKDFGAIALHRTQAPEVPEDQATEPSHVNAGPVLYRSEIYKQITYHNNDGCECQGQSNDIRKLGHRIGYLGSWKYDHIDVTRKGDTPEPNFDQFQQPGEGQPQIEIPKQIIQGEDGQQYEVQMEPIDFPQFGNPEHSEKTVQLLESLNHQITELINETKMIRNHLQE